MSPSNSKLSPRCESTSCIQNKNGKRTFLTSNDDITYDNDIYYKRKKSIKHSQVDINNAVLSSPNGYMTRNKLKKQLTKNSELIEATAIEHNISRIDNVKSKGEKACKNRKSSSQIYKKKLQLGYIFSNDISSPYPGKQLDTECKKSIPSLFESDSDSEIDGFQLNNIKKNEVKEISTCNSNPDNICSTLNKNVEMRTYFNKKSYYNNKSNTKSLNTFEKSKQEPSKLDNMVHDSNLFKNISQNYSRTNKPLKGTGSSTKECVQTNTMGDDFIIVTESFIRQLNNEDQMIKTESQEQHKSNQVVSTIPSTDNELNKNNMCIVDTNIDNTCSKNFDSSTCSDLLLKQDMDVIKVSDKCIPYKTTNIVENSLMSIFDEPKENILVESYTNVDDLINYSDSNTSSSISENIIELNSLQTFDFDNSNSDFCIENHPTSENNVFKEENITCHLPLDQIKSNSITDQYFDTVMKEEIKIKSNSFNSKINHSCLLENDNLSSNKDNYSKLNKNLGSKCYCKNFSSFNNNDNKIFTSKIKHFAFNNNAKKIRQKILHQKHLEANILKILITKERKNIIQSKDHIPIFDSISINKKYEKCNNLKDNDHIKPSILSMLKDVYVDVDYLTEYCDYNTSDNKLPESHKNNKDIKFNIQPSKVKPVEDNIHIMFKDNSASTSNYTTKIKPINPKPFYEKDDNFNKKYIIDNTSTSNNTTRKYPINFNSCDENNVNSNKNKIIDNVSTSNNTIKNKSTNIKPYDESYVNFHKNEIINEVNTSNSTITNKSTNIKPYDESYGNLNKNEIINEVNTSNSIITNKSTNIKPYDESYVNLNKNEIIDNASTLNTTMKNKLVNFKPCDGSYLNFNKNKIIDNVFTSNNTVINKSTNTKLYDKNDVNLNKNEIIDETNISNSTTKNKSINAKPCDENSVNFNKNEINDNIFTISATMQNKLINLKPCDGSYLNFNKNKIIDVKIDSKSKIKVEDNFNFYTADIKYDSKTEKCSGLKINPFDNNHLSDNTIIINEENDSKEEFKMTEVESNNMQSNNILSSANININHEFTQTKLTHFLKDENKPVAALIENEKETNILNVFEPPQYKNIFDTSDIISSKADISCPILPYISQSDEPINSLFDLPADDIDFSLNINSSNDDDDGDDNDDDDDDNRLLIEDIEQNVDGNVTKNSTLKLANSSNDERSLNSSSAVNTNFTIGIELFEKNLINPIKKQLSDINSSKNEKVLNTILPEKKCDLSNSNYENSCLLKKENNSLDDCMSIEMCNEFYKIKSLNKNIDKNESLPRNIKDILKEMYVDELFISTCQHMVDLYNDDDQLKNDVFFHMNEYQNMQSDMTVRDIKNDNVEKKKKSDFNQLISTDVETLWKTELNGINQNTNKPSNPTIIKNSIAMQEPNDVKSIYPELRQSNSTLEETIKSEINNSNQQIKHINPIKTQKSNSSQNPKNVKSNMKIRIHLKEFILSNKPLNAILESKEFRNLRFFDEEEIASSIGVFLFEHSICPPIITGLSVYKENYDQLKNEEKNKILASTNLNISCPEIMKLTSITLALVKMLRSDTLIEVILNVIRKNVLKKQMNTDHTIDFQLIKQTVYFVDICVRSRMLKTLQLFIFDSMVFLPNKYCCIIFLSLLLWKNCLPRSINNEEDPVIITVISYLIAKKKFYSEEIAGCDIFQRELINLLSCHFNYTFTTDMPTNFIQHKHKPDFFVSVVMFLKCCNPKDLVEFIVNCLFPIIDNYLNTQQNEMYAIKTLESINMVMEPFKTTCNTTVATYLKKCKDPINGFKKNGKEHVYNTIYNSYKILQNKFIEYLNDSRPRSQYFEELLMSIILMLGSVDYLTSCLSLLQWKPKFALSAILSKKIFIFKSVLGHNIVWDKLYAIKDIKTLKCLVNSCLLNKDVYDTIVQLHNIRWQLK
ncbi:uncharacterized protein MAL13P1.304-like isoform X3 [Aphis gossypii]|uniref:uncharacterized protein MAL13P1.304-like isoform X3 n=1 Tax=Aphis gossypii TaxID=80765 RepID=UPI002159B202|nr:uncharacterized protein MAL13P1.304-like isoform X3 [Aphis gossypii]